MKNIHVPINPTYHEILNENARRWEELKDDRYREYRRKWVKNPKNFILESAPLHLDIEPTNACNLKCPMCPRTVLISDGRKFDIGKMPLETYKQIIDEAATIGVYSIKLNWLGEPLVHPDLIEMVRYAKEKGIIDVMFNTNAVLLTQSISKSFIEAGLDKLFFSFDSPVKKKYEEIRIGADFDKTLENIKNVNQMRESLKRVSPLTRVSMVLMDDNRDEYEEFVELFRDIVDIVAYVDCRKPVAEETDQHLNSIKFACSQLWQRMFISWNGDCIICCVDSEKRHVVGNIHNATIRSIWLNETYSQLRKLHQSGRWHEMDICRGCSLPEKEESGSY